MIILHKNTKEQIFNYVDKNKERVQNPRRAKTKRNKKISSFIFAKIKFY